MNNGKATDAKKVMDNRASEPLVPSESHMQEIGKQVTQKKRGSKSISLEETTTATRPEISEILKNSLYWRKHPKIQSDEECAERLNEFFSHWAETGEIPTVEKMCLALGYTRMAVWYWEQGSQGKARKEMIEMAKEILASIDAELVSRGKIPQITYIFRAKNFFGLSDKTEVVLTPNNPLESNMSSEELRERYELNAPNEDE